MPNKGLISELVKNSYKRKSKCQQLSCVRLFATRWIVARQAPLSMVFPRLKQLSFPFSRDLSDPGIKSGSPTLQTDSLLSELTQLNIKRTRKYNFRIGKGPKQTFFPHNIYIYGLRAHEKIFNIINAIKTTLRYCLIPVRMAIIKKTQNNNSWQRYTEKVTVVHCWYIENW